MARYHTVNGRREHMRASLGSVNRMGTGTKSAQLRCAWFRGRQRGPTINLKNGDQVLSFGQVSIYEARGDYQLIVEQIEPAGEGALQRQFEALKKKLAAEGLFEPDRKQALPVLPRRIGVITSPTGAAIRDILSVLRRRFPAIPVVVYPAAVQGDAAVPELIAALEAAIRRDSPARRPRRSIESM